MSATKNTELNVENTLQELKKDDVVLYNQLVSYFEKYNIQPDNNSLENKEQNKLTNLQSKALKCFDKSPFNTNKELRNLTETIDVLSFVKYTNTTTTVPTVVKNIVVSLGPFRMEILFHGIMKFTDYKGNLTVLFQNKNNTVVSSAYNVLYKKGSHLSFMVPESMVVKTENTIQLNKDTLGSLTIEDSMFLHMNFKLTSKLMFSYYIEFVLSEMLKEIVE